MITDEELVKQNKKFSQDLQNILKVVKCCEHSEIENYTTIFSNTANTTCGQLRDDSPIDTASFILNALHNIMKVQNSLAIDLEHNNVPLERFKNDVNNRKTVRKSTCPIWYGTLKSCWGWDWSWK